MGHFFQTYVFVLLDEPVALFLHYISFILQFIELRIQVTDLFEERLQLLVDVLDIFNSDFTRAELI